MKKKNLFITKNQKAYLITEIRSAEKLATMLPPQAFLPGYLIYLLEIFLPGIGFGELLGIWKAGSSILERLALAFGLGLSIDTSVFLVRTSKVAGLAGMDLTTVYFLLAIGLGALLASLSIRRKFAFPTRIQRADIALLILILIQGIVLLLYLAKYPIFPQYASEDFRAHVQYTLGLISGTTTSIPGGLLYFGVHYQLASSLLLVGGEPLVTIQHTMSLLVLFSPLLFYSGARRIFSSQRAGLVAAITYTLSGTIWYTMVFDSGLYSNFFGILSALILIVALALVVEAPKSLSYWILYLLAVVNGYMSHYTLLTILPAVMLLPVLQFALKRENVKNYVAPLVVLLLPPLIAPLIFPNLVHNVLLLASSTGGSVSGSTTLSQALGSIPVLSYLAVIIYNDFELVALIILCGICLYKSIHARNSLFFIPAVWLIALFVVAPMNVGAWRFSDEALVPLVIMGSYGLVSLFPGSSKKAPIGKRMKGRRERGHLYNYVSVLIFFGALIIGSYGQMVVSDSIADTELSSQTQSYVYQAIYWLEPNTPNNSSYLSVSDWRFTYTDLLIGRESQYTFENLPSVATGLAKNVSAQYIIVTRVVTEQIPNYASFFPWNNFPTTSNSNLSLVYSNPDVRIYQVIKES